MFYVNSDVIPVHNTIIRRELYFGHVFRPVDRPIIDDVSCSLQQSLCSFHNKHRTERPTDVSAGGKQRYKGALPAIYRL